MVGAVTTYLIILLQFQLADNSGSKEKNECITIPTSFENSTTEY